MVALYCNISQYITLYGQHEEHFCVLYCIICLPPAPPVTKPKKLTRTQRRNRKKAAAGAFNYKVRDKLSESMRNEHVVEAQFATARLSCTLGAYRGQRGEARDAAESVAQLKREGYEVMSWDGRSVDRIETRISADGCGQE